MQPSGHAALPVQTNGAQVGTPAAPGGRVEHVPLAVAPAATEHTSHDPAQAVLQHTLFLQAPDRH